MTTRDPTSRGFKSVIELIEQSLEFEPASYNNAYLDRRITSRMRRTGADSYQAYKRILADDPEEQQALLDALSVNVTGFFRNPDVWDALRSLLRDLTATQRSVTCWSAACSDGREPYSLAMLAGDDPEISANRLDIIATDIDDEALDNARSGIYQTTTTTDIEGELNLLSDYSTFITKHDTQFEVKSEIKDMVRFDHHDLIRDPPLSDVDLLLCRNILIYIDSDYKETIFETLTGALKNGGYLVIGMSETPPATYRSMLEPVKKSKRIYKKVN